MPGFEVSPGLQYRCRAPSHLCRKVLDASDWLLSQSRRPYNGSSTSFGAFRHAMATAAAEGQGRRLALPKVAELRKQAMDHEIFDEVKFKVRSGSGGHGEILKEGKGRMVPNFKYSPGGRQPKNIWLPAGEPAAGQSGANVLLTVDGSLDNLLHLHKRSKYHGKNGRNGDQNVGSQGPLKLKPQRVSRAEPLKLAVPPGTVVKNKKGMLLGELLQQGDTLLVAKGGRGGEGVVTPSGHLKAPIQPRRSQAAGVETYAVEDINFGLDAEGLPGEEVSLHLLLRVVADVGIVGLPNAGKSSLLSSLTRASPEVASYPFTTLMPNLGVIKGKEPFEVGENEETAFVGQRATLADLPGLIQGAHNGRGLGRMFLRHLRRARAILHVLDASADDPSADYWVVREELRLYNPDYCCKPHVVALNKMDLEDASELEAELISDVQNMARSLQNEFDGLYTVPDSIVPTSAVSGHGLLDLSRAIQDLCTAASSF